MSELPHVFENYDRTSLVTTGMGNSISFNLASSPTSDELEHILLATEQISGSRIEKISLTSENSTETVNMILGSVLEISGITPSVGDENFDEVSRILHNRTRQASDSYSHDYHDEHGNADIDKIIDDLYDKFDEMLIEAGGSAKEPVALQVLHLLKTKFSKTPSEDDYFTKAERILRLMILVDTSNQQPD